MDSAGLWMLLAVAILMIATGLPSWMVLIGVALLFAVGGVALGKFSLSLLTALPARINGLLEHDLLQALPLYVFMGALLNRLPLAGILFRVFARGLRPTGAGMPLSGLGLSILLAPMNGSVGAGVAMLSRTVQPKLDAAGMPVEQSAALTCVASTLGVVIPPSLVLILLGDAMLRAHTEAGNAGGRAIGSASRIINTQDVFHAALVPAAILLLLYSAVTWWRFRRDAKTRDAPPAVSSGDIATAIGATLFIGGLLAAVALGYLYAVEAAATGGMALLLFGVVTRSLTRPVLIEVLKDTLNITGALFALLLAATVFTLVVRAFGTDRWIAAQIGLLNGPWSVLAVILGGMALCALVLDAFEMIFVVIPLLAPPMLMQVPDAAWVAALILLILQASFLIPPFGYSVLMVRNRSPHALDGRKLVRALLPYVAAQLIVLILVLAFPALLWRDAAVDTADTAPPASNVDLGDMLGRQLDQNQAADEKQTAKTPVK